mmetsp:Transcript_98127/g.194300  ORF Transcript_98127/g.194300 Transcript_98127/m.194300 type:complete len:263 (-) Transcript_98127:51-839(-)
MLSLMILSSGTSSKYLTSARNELPCAAIRTFLPFLSSGAMALLQKGNTRRIVSCSDSAVGICHLGTDAYFASSLGWYGLSSAIGGGGTSKDRRHCVTCSSPNFSVVSALFMPCRSPYILSFNRQVLVTGIQSRSISSNARPKVLIARFCSDVKASSTVMLASRMSLPALAASAAPFSVTSTSTQPVNRFSRFHCDSPCLNNTSVCTPFSSSAMSRALGACRKTPATMSTHTEAPAARTPLVLRCFCQRIILPPVTAALPVVI